jgi:beta-lactamase superfamily II metal-dependent hydrolase
MSMHRKHKTNRTVIIAIAAVIVVAIGVCIAQFTGKQDSSYTVTQYPGSTGYQGTFYTITDNAGHLIVIDGGWAGDADYVRSVIGRYGNQVDAWIITHPHQDHAGAFNEIFADPQGITVKAVYDNGFDYEFIESVGEPYDDITVMENYHALTQALETTPVTGDDGGTASGTTITHLTRGDSVDICGLKVDVLNAFDDVVKANVGSEADYQNNAALLLLISSSNSSMLFCSDIKFNMEDCLLPALSGVTCDYVEVAHHGNWGFSLETYLNLGASGYFFDAPPGIVDVESFPAYTLKRELLDAGKETYDFYTGENKIILE